MFIFGGHISLSVDIFTADSPVPQARPARSLALSLSHDPVSNLLLLPSFTSAPSTEGRLLTSLVFVRERGQDTGWEGNEREQGAGQEGAGESGETLLGAIVNTLEISPEPPELLPALKLL